MNDQDPGNVFAFPDFTRSSRCMKPSSHPRDPFFHLDPAGSLRPSSPKIVGQHGARPLDSDGFFKLPSLLALPDAQEVAAPQVPLQPLHDTELGDIDIFDDCWHRSAESVVPAAILKTWEGFFSHEHLQQKPLFITEAGPHVFDAALASEDDPLGLHNTKAPVVQSGPYIAALLALALGRGSNLFTWNEEKQHFTSNLAEMRITGYSSDVLSGIERRCLESGRITRTLSSYIQATYKTQPSPAKVALSKALDNILSVVQTKLGGQARKIRSILHLQSLIQPVYSILTYFRSLLGKTSRCHYDEDVLSIVFDEAEAMESGDALLREVMRHVLTLVSVPWLDFVEQWIGVKPEHGVLLSKDGPSKSFVKIEDDLMIDDAGFESEQRDFVLDERRMPRFIPRDMALRLFEVGRNLRLLRTHHPEHPVSHPAFGSSSKPPELLWRYKWRDIHDFQNKVALYETRLWQDTRGRSEITTDAGRNEKGPLERTKDYELEYFGCDESQLEVRLARSIMTMNQTPALGSVNALSELLTTRLLEDESTMQTKLGVDPHWSVIPSLSFGPLIAVQDNIVNRHYMKILVDLHGLREHINVQKEFHLLGNGVFCSRLSHALFDPDLETAERQAGVALSGGNMGLRLSGRDTWPPASSELRLALMGILVECYSLNSEESISSTKKPRELPGDISFAVRDLSSEEIDKCLDPGSLEALDFLRLSYKPPPALMPVITTVILVKYDRIFKLLLRVLRMLYVVGQIHRDTISGTSRWYEADQTSLRFRYEAERFVTAIAAYFFETGIESPWRRFEAWLDVMEASLQGDEMPSAQSRSISPNDLRDEHEWMLDSIMQNLFLRKRHQPVLGLLDEIFTLILRFSHRTRLQATGRVDPEDDGSYTRGLYRSFRKKVDVFVTVCRGLSEKGAEVVVKGSKEDGTAERSQRTKTASEEHTIERLLISLDMTSFYATSRA